VKEPIVSHVYSNGLVLVAEPIQSLESAAFTFLVPAGCALDPEGLAGLGSLTCEMTLRGSGPRDSRQFIQDLENLGVERGESVSNSHTSFSGATLAKNLVPALEIFADLIRRPHFPADQLEAARLVAIQELSAIEDEPSQKVMLELRRRQYPEPWGRSSYGELPALESIRLEDIRGYFAQHYHPNGAILGVAGQIDWKELKDQVGRLFGDWAPRQEPAPATGRSFAKREHLPHESNQTQIGIGFQSLPYRDQDYFQAWGAVGVLSGGMSSRLFTEVREKRGLCYSVYATMHTLRDRGSVLCYAGTSVERAQETLDVTLSELVRLAKGIEADELARLKARIKSSLIMQQESSSSRSGSIARDWYHLGQVRTLDQVGALVDGLSRESINAYLAAHPPGDFTIVTLGPSPLEVSVGIS
jgi:predicted Zn-dependent peptidase